MAAAHPVPAVVPRGRPDQRLRSFQAGVERRLGYSLNLARAGADVVRLLVPALGGYAFLMVPDGTGTVHWWHARGSGPDASGPVECAAGRVPGSAVGDWLAATADAVPGQLYELRPGARSTPGGPVEGGGVLVPLSPGSLPGAALVIMRPAGWPAPSTAERRAIQQFAGRVAAVMQAAMLVTEQARLVNTLRAALLPARLPDVAGVRFGAAFRPAREALRIGGDFYDVQVTRGGALCVVGDICGKGAHAAATGGRLRESLRAVGQVVGRPARLLRVLNRTLAEGDDIDDMTRIASLVVVLACPDPGGSVTLRIAVGGHVPPLVVRGDATVEPVEVPGMLLGVDRQARFGEARVRLAPGESVVLYSDGVTEARNRHTGQVFGMRRLVDVVTDHRATHPTAVAQRIEQCAVEWLAGGEHDDITVLVVQATPPAAGSAT